MSINPTKEFTTIRKLCIARVLPDFLSVLLLGLDPFGVSTDTLRISNAQLGSHIGNHSDGILTGSTRKVPRNRRVVLATSGIRSK